MKANLNRGAVIFTSIVAGMIIGLFAGVYLYTAWVSADTILNNASPKYLAYDRETLTPQYRDFYVVRAAEKYQRDVQSGLANPLQGAYDVLGLTTGDTTIDEAIEMVQLSSQVINKDVNTNGAASLFTQNEQLAVDSLLRALTSARDVKTAPTVDYAKYQPAVARNTTRVVGFLLLLILALVAFLVIYWVDRLPTHDRPDTSRRYPRAPRHPAGSIIGDPGDLYVAATPGMGNIPPDVSPTEPGIARVPPSPTPSGPAPASAPASAGAPLQQVTVDVPLVTFAPTVYRHGDDHFDEDFAIDGPMHEMIGECGASVADRIGVDMPARVSALALWVFDKNDFQSTTKILMTDYAWNDPVIRGKLKSRGDAVLAANGSVVEILTTMLRVEVQVNDLLLNSDNNPPQGYFQNVSLTFTVYKR